MKHKMKNNHLTLHCAKTPLNLAPLRSLIARYYLPALQEGF